MRVITQRPPCCERSVTRCHGVTVHAPLRTTKPVPMRRV
jgi:hypothetical protein